MSEKSQRRTEFDRRYKAGTWAARLETQDKVAAIVAIEAFGGNLELCPADLAQREGRIAFEAREDFEIRWTDGRQYVSVKDRQVERSDLKEAIRNLALFQREVATREVQSIRVEAAGLSGSARTFYEDVKRLRSLDDFRRSHDYESAAIDFHDEHGIDAEFAAKLIVCERRIGDNSVVAAATFAHAMRNAVRVYNYGDTELLELFNELSSSVMRERRLARGILDFGELERLLLAPLVPLRVAAFEVDYVRTRFGYIQDADRRATLREEARLVSRFASNLMREWRRTTFWDRLKDVLYRGPVLCISCNHPLMANFNGRNGIACPDCGYQPFQTLFYACDCGSGGVVERQPDLSSFELVRDAVRALRNEGLKCMGCGQPPANEKFLGRIFGLPIPYPIVGYPARELTVWREKLGWRSSRIFRSQEDGNLTPREALQRTIGEDAEMLEQSSGTTTQSPSSAESPACGRESGTESPKDSGDGL